MEKPNKFRIDNIVGDLLRERREKMKARKSRARPVRAPKAQPPLRTERAYYADLRAMVAELQRLTQLMLVPELDRITAQARAELGHKDSARTDDYPEDITRILNGIKFTFYQKFTDKVFEKYATDAARGADEQAGEGLSKALKRVVGIDLKNVFPDSATKNQFKSFIAENVSLIKSIPEQYFGQIEQIVRRGAAAGDRAQKTAEKIRARYSVTKNRAKLIARDQANKLYGTITQIRQTSMGVEKYEWSTSLDERVRPSHAAREGKVFSWDDPPEDGHPGQPINCRCTAIPVFEE